jgi:hypothetical protein
MKYNERNRELRIHLSPYHPEVILYQKDRKLFFNFYDINMDSNYLVFIDPIMDYIQKSIEFEQKPFAIFFDKSLIQLEDFDYSQKMLEKLKSLNHQEMISYFFKE